MTFVQITIRLHYMYSYLKNVVGQVRKLLLCNGCYGNLHDGDYTEPKQSFEPPQCPTDRVDSRRQFVTAVGNFSAVLVVGAYVKQPSADRQSFQ